MVNNTEKDLGDLNRGRRTILIRFLLVAILAGAAVLALGSCSLFGFLDGVELQVNGQAVSSHDFGSLLLTRSSSPVTVSIVNKGAFPFTLGGMGAITVSGTSVPDFVISGTPDDTIQSGSSTSFTVTFTPTATGSRAATVAIRPYNGSSTSISISGSATSQALISLSDGQNNIDSGSTYNLGSAVYVGYAQTFTITNEDSTYNNLLFGPNPVTIDSADACFSLANIQVPNYLGYLSTGTFQVQFTAPAGDTSQHTATITIFNSATGYYTFQITATGSGMLG